MGPLCRGKALIGAVLILPSVIWAQDKDPSTAIPMDLTSGRPIVHVFINSDGPFKFVFDTAASRTIVSSDLAARLRLPATGVAVVSAPGSGVAIQVPRINIKELRCGDFKFFDRSAVVISDKSLFQSIKADGVICLQDFDGYVVSVDYSKKRLIVESGALPETDEPGTVPLKFVEGVPGIDILVNGEKVFCVLDSGSPFSIALPSKSPLPNGARVRGQATSITSRFPFVEKTLEGLVVIGPISLKDPVVQLLRGMPYGNLGSRFFSECVVSFDLRSSKVKIVRKTKPAHK